MKVLKVDGPCAGASVEAKGEGDGIGSSEKTAASIEKSDVGKDPAGTTKRKNPADSAKPVPPATVSPDPSKKAKKVPKVDKDVVEAASVVVGICATGVDQAFGTGPRCSRCKQPVVEGNPGRLIGKQSKYRVCNICNTRSSQLYRLFGGWPSKHFESLDAKQQAEFYKNVRDKKGAKDLKPFYDEFIRVEVEESKKSGDRTEYLPLKVWKKKGFPWKKIKANCKDTKVDPLLGKCYGVTVAQKEEYEQHRKVTVSYTHLTLPTTPYV